MHRWGIGRIFGGMTPVSDGDFPGRSIEANLRLPGENAVGLYGNATRRGITTLTGCREYSRPCTGAGSLMPSDTGVMPPKIQPGSLHRKYLATLRQTKPDVRFSNQS